MTDSIDFRQEFENDTYISYSESLESSENTTSDFGNSTKVPSACGKLDADYMRIWGQFQWWLEGIGFTGLGIAGKSRSIFDLFSAFLSQRKYKNRLFLLFTNKSILCFIKYSNECPLLTSVFIHINLGIN